MRGIGVHFSDCGGYGGGEDEEIVDVMVRGDLPEALFRPSIGQDVEKVSLVSPWPSLAFMGWCVNDVGQLHGNREYPQANPYEKQNG